jgi:hypothetical protein
MQVLKGSEVQSKTKFEEKKKDEEVDLDYIDLFISNQDEEERSAKRRSHSRITFSVQNQTASCWR